MHPDRLETRVCVFAFPQFHDVPTKYQVSLNAGLLQSLFSGGKDEVPSI